MKFDFIIFSLLFLTSRCEKDRKLMFSPYLNNFEHYAA